MSQLFKQLISSEIDDYLKNTASIVYMVDGTNYNVQDIAK